MQIKSEVTPKWRPFGEAIGVGKSVLDKCSNYPDEQSIIEILDNWLRDHSGQPTWHEVAEALKVIDLPTLALEIENIYETGIIYITERPITIIHCYK